MDKTKPYLHSMSLKLRENQLAQAEIWYITDAFKYLLLTTYNKTTVALVGKVQ